MAVGAAGGSCVLEPEDELDSLPFERSSIAAIGARRRWRLFGRDGSAEAPEPARGADEEAFVPNTMLGALAARAGHEAASAPAASRSMLSLDRPVPGGPKPEAPETPLVAHSTIASLAGLEEPAPSPFPIERGILASLLFHVLLFALLVTVSARAASENGGGLLDQLAELAEQDEIRNQKIPIVFQEAPGPARENPKRSPFSDADRRAAGGDRSKPKAESPFVPPSRGIAGLAPGPRGPKAPGNGVTSSPGQKGGRPREQAAPLQADKNAPEGSPLFPSAERPGEGSGPREISKLAGLDRAIEEAARSAVGGEGGAPPPNPEGGFVDSGPLSFDTTWYDWGPYAAEMVRRIKLHWDVPELARLGWKGRVTIRFYILADGRVADARILRSSGIPPFDFAALQAIEKSSPFRPLPEDLHEEREGVTVTFFYNMRPGPDDADGR
jgi:TonB family protein